VTLARRRLMESPARPHIRAKRLTALLAISALVMGACSSTPAVTTAPSSAAASAAAPSVAASAAAPSVAASAVAKTCKDFGAGPLVVESSGSLVGQAEQVAYKNPFSAECNVQIQTVDAVADVGAQLAAQFAAGNITFDVISGRT